MSESVFGKAGVGVETERVELVLHVEAVETVETVDSVKPVNAVESWNRESSGLVAAWHRRQG